MSDCNPQLCLLRTAWCGRSQIPKASLIHPFFLLRTIFIFSIFLVLCLQSKAYAEERTLEALQQGVAYLRQGNLVLAEDAFSTILSAEPDHAMAHFHLGQLFITQGRLNQALKHLERSVQIAPFMVSAYLRLAEVYEKKGDFKNAIRKLETVSPKIENKNKRLVEAVSNGLKRLRGFEKQKDRLRDGIELLRTEKIPEAESVFRELLSLQPENPDLHHFLGVVLGIETRFDEAIEHFKTSLLIKPTLTKSSIRLSELYEVKDELVLARKELERALIFLEDTEGDEAQSLEAKLNKIEDRIEVKRLTRQWTQRIEEKEIDAAILTLQEIVQVNPDHDIAYFNLGNLSAQKERYDRAETFLKKAIEINPEYTEAHQRLGQVYEVTRLFELAAAQYRKGLATRVGKIAPMKEILEQSIVRTEAGKRQSMLVAEEAFRKGEQAVNRDDLDLAVSMFEQAVFFSREDPELLFQLGLAYEKKGLFDLAKDAMIAVIKMRPDHVESQRRLALLDERAGFLYQALKKWKRLGDNTVASLRLEKRLAAVEAETLLLMAQAKTEADEENYMAAIETLKKASELAPDDPRIRITLGKLYTKTSMFKEAYAELNAAGFFEPSDGVAYFYLGELYTAGEQWRNAESHYDKAMHSPDITEDLRIDVEKGRGLAIRHQKDFEIATWFFNRARRHLDRADYLTAIAHFQKVVGLFPMDIRSHYSIGTAYENLNKFKEAGKYYRKVLEMNPNHHLALQHLGLVNEMEGRNEAAIEAYRKNLALWDGRETSNSLWVKNRLKPLEKRYSVTINQVLISYDSNPDRSSNPEADLRSNIGFAFTYLLKKDRLLQIPIRVSTDNTFFFQSNTIFSQESVSISAIQTRYPFTYSLGYNYLFGLVEGGATGDDHVGLLNLTWYSKKAYSIGFEYTFDTFISASNKDFDATRQTVRLTYRKDWAEHHVSTWYRFFDNDAKLSDQASLSNGVGFSYVWNTTDKVHTTFSYEINRVDFVNFDSLAVSTVGNIRRKNTSQSATLDVSYRVQKSVALNASYVEQRNSSNLLSGATSLEEQLSGQAASLGDYSQRLLRLNISWFF